MNESPSRKKLNLAEVTAIGIGGMVGGGIFAVLGLAISLAGHAVAFTLAGAGVIALLTGLSYASMGLCFGGNGGSFTYIAEAFTSRIVGHLAGWILVAGYVGTLALYASAFGAYGQVLIQGTGGSSHWIAGLLAASGLCAFLAVNLIGAKLSGGVELTVVAIKLGLLLLFAGAGMMRIHASHFTPILNHGLLSPFAAVALIFVAYEGFELIPNAIDEMENPQRNLRRALVIAIVLTSLIYVAVAIAALGNLTPAQIQKDQEYVLAVAARPTLGHLGFILIGIAALLSTASAINATLFGAARLSMVMASERALPKVFAKQERHQPVPWVSLLVLAGFATVLTLTADLPTISTFASATFLLIFTGVNVAAWRLRKRIHIHPLIPALGAFLTGASFLVLLWHTWMDNRVRLYWLIAFYGSATLIQLALSAWHHWHPQPASD